MRLRCGRCLRNCIFFGFRLASTLPVVSEWLAGTFAPLRYSQPTPNVHPAQTLGDSGESPSESGKGQSPVRPRSGLSASFPHGDHSVLLEQPGSNVAGNRSGTDTTNRMTDVAKQPLLVEKKHCRRLRHLVVDNHFFEVPHGADLHSCGTDFRGKGCRLRLFLPFF